MEQKRLYRSTASLFRHVVGDAAFLSFSGWQFFKSSQVFLSDDSSLTLVFLAVASWSFWLCMAVFLILKTLRNLRAGRVRALASSDRIEVLSYSGRREIIPWSNVRYVEAYDENTKLQRKTIYIHYAEKGRRKVQALDLLPASPEEAAAFLAVLRQNWPDMDKPWQEQLQNRKAG